LLISRLFSFTVTFRSWEM